MKEGEVGGGERATLSSQDWKNLRIAQTKTNASDAVAVMRYAISQQEATRKEERVKEEDTCSPFTFSLPPTPARSSRNQKPGGERRDLGVGGGVTGSCDNTLPSDEWRKLISESR